MPDTPDDFRIDLDNLIAKMQQSDPSTIAFKPKYVVAPPFQPPADPEKKKLMNKINFVVVVDSDSPHINKAIKDVDTNTVTVYLSEGYLANTEPNYERLHEFWMSNQTEVTAGQIAMLRVDPEGQRTCQFFTAGRAQVEKFESAMAKTYVFDRPHRGPVCSHPELIKINGQPNPPCTAAQTQSSCSYYSQPGWEAVRQATYTYEDTNFEMVLEALRRGWGNYDYRLKVTAVDDKGNLVASTADVVDELKFDKNNSTTLLKANELFEAAVKRHDAVEVPVVAEVDNDKEEYLKYAFS